MDDVQIIEKAIRENKYLEFIYHDSRRVVAPYRLEELKSGSMVLSGVREGGGGMRSYKLEEISSLDLLNRSFNPSLFHSMGGGQASGPATAKHGVGNLLQPIKNLFSKFKR